MTFTLREHVARMARYNAWMNDNLYAATAKLPPDELARPRGAFFGSLIGTLNHVVVGDTIWLQRFAGHPAAHRTLDPVRALTPPTSLDQVLFTEFAPLRSHRRMLDATIVAWVAELTDDDLQHVLLYHNTKGAPFRRRLVALLMHFFNHQTHHRGQATTLLFQAGIDPGVTDLLATLPEDGEVD